MTRALLRPALAVALTLAACNGESVTGDTTAPVITLNGDDPYVVEFGDSFTDPGASVSDDVDTGLSVTVSGSVDTGTLGDYTLTYTATDAAGNEAEPVERTVSVVDTTAPVITLVGDNPLTLEEGDAFTDPGATVTDAADTTVEVTVTGSVDAGTAGTYTLTYDAVDASGNVADSVRRVVEVVYSGELFVVADGPDLLLVGLDPDGTLSERSRASFAEKLLDYNTNHVVFGLAINPADNTLYATSFNECGASPRWTDGCWGNGRIDRFTYDVNEITHEGVAWLAQVPLRLTTPTFDKGTGELSMSLWNQGTDPVDVSAVYGTSLPAKTTVGSSCDKVTLQPGDSCDVVVTTLETGLPSSPTLVVETDVADFDTTIWYDSSNDAHRAYGLDPDWAKESPLPRCADDNGWSANQYGACAITELAISPDGTRVYVNEDDWDEGLILELGDDGTMSFLDQSDDGMWYQGIAVNAANTAVYNGERAFSNDKDQLEYASGSNAGNATSTFDFGGTELLCSTLNHDELAIYDISKDPLAPDLITSWEPKEMRAQFQHHSADGGIFAVIDQDHVGTASFDGKVLTELDVLDAPVEVGKCKDCSWAGRRRGVQVSDDGMWAVTSAFVNAYDEETVAKIAFQGLVTSYAIDATTGDLEQIDTLELAGMSRALLAVPSPE